MKTLVGSCVILFALAAIAYTFGIRTKQAAGAQGYLTCDGRPAANILVKLYDKDRFTSMDDKMASTKTDSPKLTQSFTSTTIAMTVEAMPTTFQHHDPRQVREQWRHTSTALQCWNN
uniref:Uncharacterized protein n=1 Tax=Ditylenchus dipsaci TaxID=166011 RepID=A0A915EM66_9BILA